MKNYYESSVVYEKEYGEVLIFETDAIMNDSNDIVNYAVKKELLNKTHRNNVRYAMCISKYEYEYIKK